MRKNRSFLPWVVFLAIIKPFDEEGQRGDLPGVAFVGSDRLDVEFHIVGRNVVLNPVPSQGNSSLTNEMGVWSAVSTYVRLLWGAYEYVLQRTARVSGWTCTVIAVGTISDVRTLRKSFWRLQHVRQVGYVHFYDGVSTVRNVRLTVWRLELEPRKEIELGDDEGCGAFGKLLMPGDYEHFYPDFEEYHFHLASETEMTDNTTRHHSFLKPCNRLVYSIMLYTVGCW